MNKCDKSISAFYVTGIFFLICAEAIVVNNKYIVYFLMILAFVMFLLYSIMRFFHYKIYFKSSKALFYMLIDNIPFALGTIFYFIMKKYYMSPTEVNFIVAFVLTIFLIPTGVGNERLKKLGKK
jgi:hypothetical protein